VGTDGRAKTVTVQSDPGHGFGEAARRCAFREKYDIGLDRFGKAATRTTPPFTVTFTR
jgi:protein TonB